MSPPQARAAAVIPIRALGGRSRSCVSRILCAMAAKDDLGRRGEDLATAYLQSAGLTIVERNWRCPLGEIDIVARDGGWLVVAEVKTRSSVAFGHPLEAITPVKLARLRRLAGEWRAQHPDVTGSLRIDAVAVIAPREGRPVIEHLAGVS